MNFIKLPDGLPPPIDDGSAYHLESSNLPNISFSATSGEMINLCNLSGLTVIYVYPMTGRPGTPLPDGWDEIPGARGCTPQSCGFRNHYVDLQKFNTRVFGLSVQSSEYQREAKERLHLPFDLLSDVSLKLKNKWVFR